jgi:hypothetical protein
LNNKSYLKKNKTRSDANYRRKRGGFKNLKNIGSKSNIVFDKTCFAVLSRRRSKSSTWFMTQKRIAMRLKSP